MIDIMGIFIGLLVSLSSLIGAFVLVRWLYKKLTYEPEDSISSGASIINEVSQPSPSKSKVSVKNQESNMSKFEFFNDKISIRFIVIGVIALLMLIPISNVSSLVKERHGLYNTVLSGIASQWGRPQIITGPVLVLPIVEKYVINEKVKTTDGAEKAISKDVYRNKNVVVLPKKLETEIKLDEHYRYRSIYKSLVYQAQVKNHGVFVLPDINKLSDNLHQVRHDKAFVLVGLSDTKAINEVSKLEFGGVRKIFEPGTKLELSGINSGFHAPVDMVNNQKEYAFDFNFETKGSANIRFSAFGETSVIKVNSSWQHPSFQGGILPTERSVTDEGFNAKWVIPSLARNFPQTWIAENRKYSLDSLLTGVDLYEPVFLYSLVSRAVKYGILFIALTFLTFLIFEITYKSRLHYVQYALVGLSLGMFFLVLLSLSEHMEFLKSYTISGAITVTSISLYTWFSGRKLGQSIAVFVLLAALYIILYSLLQLEDYALLMGTGLLLMVLLVLMWITRNLKVAENEAS